MMGKYTPIHVVTEAFCDMCKIAMSFYNTGPTERTLSMHAMNNYKDLHPFLSYPVKFNFSGTAVVLHHLCPPF
jgi:hypothetical protein